MKADRNRADRPPGSTAMRRRNGLKTSDSARPLTILNRLFLGYSFVLVASLIVLAVLFGFTSISMLRAAHDEGNLEFVRKVALSVDLVLYRIQDTAMQLAMDPAVKSFVEKTPVSGLPYASALLQAHQTVGRSLSHQDIVHSILLYSAAKGRFYSSRSMPFDESDYPDRELLRGFQGGSAARLWTFTRVPQSSVEDAVIGLLETVPFGSPTKRGFVQVNVSVDTLLGSVSRLLERTPGVFLVVDSAGGELLRIAGKDPAARDAAGRGRLRFGETGTGPGSVGEGELDGRPANLFAVASEVNSWAYVYAIPKGVYASRLLGYQRIFLLLCLLILLLALPMANLQMRLVSRPLVRFIRTARPPSGDADREQAEDSRELERLSAIFSRLSSRVSLLLARAGDDPRGWYLRTLIAEPALAGLYPKEYEYHAARFHQPLFTVIRVWARTMGPEISSSIPATLRRVLQDGRAERPEFEVLILGPNDRCVILNHPEPIALDDVDRRLSEAFRGVADLHIAVGRTVTRLDRVALSDQDCRRAIQLSTYRHAVSVVSYDQAMRQLMGDSFDLMDNVGGLRHDLATADGPALRERIDGIFRRLEGSYLSQQMAQYVFLLLSHVLVQVYREKGLEAMALRGEISGVLPLVEEMDDLKILRDAMQGLYAAAAAGIRAQKDHQGHDELFSRIERHVEDHLGDYRLSLQQIIDEFGVSVSFVCKLFRRRTGESFVKYVSKKRVARACALLCAEGEVSVGRVAASCGYGSAYSFSRVFRAYTGYTPGQYRMSHVGKTVPAPEESVSRGA